MLSCIYSLKMLLLQGQLQVEKTDLEKLQSFGDFFAIFYSSFWFQSPFWFQSFRPTSQRQHGFQIWREDVLCSCSSGFDSPSMMSSFCVGLKANDASLIHTKGLND